MLLMTLFLQLKEKLLLLKCNLALVGEIGNRKANLNSLIIITLLIHFYVMQPRSVSTLLINSLIPLYIRRFQSSSAHLFALEIKTPSVATSSKVKIVFASETAAHQALNQCLDEAKLATRLSNYQLGPIPPNQFKDFQLEQPTV